jgi:uncharacterized protein
MDKVFIDVNIAMYAGGVSHPLREPCQKVILSIVNKQIDAWTDAEIFQEILYRYLHIGEKEKGLKVFDTFHRLLSGKILPIEDSDIQQARQWVDIYPSLSKRDLIHLAVMDHYKINEIITTDHGFVSVSRILCTDPKTFT